MTSKAFRMRTRILLSILPITLLFLMASAFFNYQLMRSQHLASYEAAQAASEAQILDSIELIDSAYRMLEAQLEKDLEPVVASFVHAYNTSGGQLSDQDLVLLKQETGNQFDFMIIDSETTIIQSTLPEGMNFNFKAFDPSLGDKITEIRLGDDIWYEQLRTNVGNGFLSKFAYGPTLDHKYLLEVAYSVGGFDQILDELKPSGFIQHMLSISPLIKDIRLYDAYGYQIVDSGENYKPTAATVAMVERAKVEKRFEISTDATHLNRVFYIELNSKREKTLADTDRIVEIVYDTTPLVLSLNQLLLTMIRDVVLLLILLSASIVFVSRRLTKPIEQLTMAAKQIEAGQFDVDIALKRTDEVGDLSLAFSTMMQKIKINIAEIESQKLILEDYNRNLESKIGERTFEVESKNKELELKNQDLELAWIKANEATEAKSNFLAMMSHEIRTPINGVIGLAALALRTNLSTRQREYVDKIKYSAENLLEIINDVLTMSKLEAGKTTLESIYFNMDEIFELLTNQLGYRAGEKGLELIVSSDPNIPRNLKGDPLRLRQVLANLVSNAIKFTTSGEIYVSVQCIESSDKQVTLQFMVRDTGIGMSPDTLEKLFEPFQQGDVSISRKYGGTGLGLSICKHFISLAGGSIWAESEKDVGSRFYFTLPLGYSLSSEAEIPVAKFGLNQQRVLIVDDSDTSRMVLREMLTPYFEHIEAVSTGEEALKLIEASEEGVHPFDIILMDWKLPERDGIDTAMAIKTYMPSKPIPAVLMITAYDLDMARQSENSIHIDAFLSKPVLRSSLIQTILQLLGTDRNKGHYSLDSQRIPVLTLTEGNGPISILLAEDNLINQQVVLELFDPEIIQLDIAMNGNMAVEAVTQKSYDLVLMDIQMPEMDGLEATRRIRTLPGGAELPIIALSAHGMEHDRENSFAAGMSDYMTKPFNAEHLFRLMIKWIKKPLSIELIDLDAPLPEDDLSFNLTAFKTRQPLRNLRGDWSKYLSMLLNFHDTYKNTEALLKSHLEEGDIDMAKGLVHRIRGIAGNLGAMELYMASQILETDLSKSNASQQIETVKAFIDELRRALSDIAALNPYKASTPAETGNYNNYELPELLRQLHDLVDAAHSDAAMLLPVIENALKTRVDARYIEQLTRQVNNYDYDDAAVTLQTIENKLNDDVTD